LWPHTSDTTRASLMLVSSSILYTRFWACVRVGTRETRGCVRARKARISGGGTKLGWINPCASSAAIQAASHWPVFGPGHCRNSWLLATYTSSGSLTSYKRVGFSMGEGAVLTSDHSLYIITLHASTHPFQSSTHSATVRETEKAVCERILAKPSAARPL